LSSIEDNYSVDDLTHRAFAASIRPDQRHDFPGAYIQVAVRECDDTTVTLDDVSGRKRPSHEVLFEILLDFCVGHDVVEQVSIGLAIAHRQTFVQVVGGDNRSQRDDKRQTVRAAQFGGINLLAL
jgi:hypothetical protein